MGKVIVTMKVMPEGPEVDLHSLETKVKAKIAEFEGQFMESKHEPVGFGIIAIVVTFAVDENKGSTDALEESLSKVENVESVQVTMVNRALG